MKVSFKKRAHDFHAWKPSLGRVFRRVFAFDCETTRIDEVRPWFTPAYVLGAGCDGEKGYFVRREDVAAFFKAHPRTEVVFHHAAFDLAVIHTLAPEIDIYQRIDKNRVWDTQLLHRLYVLGAEGHMAGRKGESDLEHCAEVYLDVHLPKDVMDAEGDAVRLSYGKWLNRPPAEIESIYLEYLARDVIVTRQVYRKLRNLLADLLSDSEKVWGWVSQEWLDEQVERWGPQTHHIQLRADIVLRTITVNGLHLDTDRREELLHELNAETRRMQKALRKQGYIASGAGSGRALQAILRRLEQQHPEMPFPRTDTGLYATGVDALQDLGGTVPFIKLLLEYRATEKLLNSFVTKMGKSVLHPSFNVLARTGRTSSFGEINAQNLPTSDAVRSCFVPSRGHVFLDADYRTIELATLAQACLAQFGLDSQMAHAINEDKDLHTVVAARVTGKAEGDVTKEERKKAKPINFGKPGGMGDRTLKEYAKTNYGVYLSDEEVQELSDAWFELFPEMTVFLSNTTDTGKELAALLNLTLTTHYEHTSDSRFLSHPDAAGREEEPNSILGGMCLKVLGTEAPCTQFGKPYTPADIDYFWSHAEARSDLLSKKGRKAVAGRQPSPRLRREVAGLVGRAGVFTLTGRLRAQASYCARHNTVFQGLAADGAKLALWQLWRAGYRIVNFVHDQVLVEVPDDANLKDHAERIRHLMIEGMTAVVPDVKVDVSYAATRRWYKDAEAVFNNKRTVLRLWSPATAKKKNPAPAG